jgi:hypothetical protein
MSINMLIFFIFGNNIDMKRSNIELLGLFAYVALVLYAISYLLSRFGANMSFFRYIGDGLLLLVVLSIAHDYASRLHLFWRVIYYVIMIVAILSYLFTIIR